MVLTGEFSRVHDPSRIIKCAGKYYVFHTGNNIGMRYSTDLINWTRGKSVLDKVPEWARKAVPLAKNDHTWAPDVIFLNNKYYLFYSFSTFGSKVSATGLVTSPTLDPESPDFKWMDQGVVLATTTESDYNAIDPAPILDAQGDLWLSIGSWNSGGIKLVKLDKMSGKPISQPVTIAAGQSLGPEAPYLYYNNGYYYLFENEGFCCRGMSSTYSVMMGRSKTITGPYLDKAGKDLAKGGGTPFLTTDGQVIGPGHIGIFSEDGFDRFTYHYYDSLNNGVATMGLQTLVWGKDGWPRAGSDLPGGRYAIISRASGLALGIHKASWDDGTPIDQFEYGGGAMQQWNVSPVGGGYYSISSLGSGKHMDLAECSAKDGTRIGQYPWLNNDCQRWRIEQTGEDTYRIISKGGATALTLPGGTKAPQALVEGHAWKGDIGQQWIFKRLP
ncbi:MAG TPA: family 43 glycosylhydrolase [Abditibacteriaceae bacterium]